MPDTADDVSLLFEDYKVKVQYVTDQFGRMWTRFSFLLTLQTALIGILIVQANQGHLILSGGRIIVASLGLVTATYWYVVGAEDRYLVALYRHHVKEVYEKLATRSPVLSEISFAGDVQAHLRKSKFFDPLEWRIPQLSTTRLAVVFPLMVLVFWVFVLCFRSGLWLI
jgi:hypothetical protein